MQVNSKSLKYNNKCESRVLNSNGSINLVLSKQTYHFPARTPSGPLWAFSHLLLRVFLKAPLKTFWRLFWVYYKSGLQPFLCLFRNLHFKPRLRLWHRVVPSNSAGAKCTAAPEAVGLPAHFKRSLHKVLKMKWLTECQPLDFKWCCRSFLLLHRIY